MCSWYVCSVLSCLRVQALLQCAGGMPNGPIIKPLKLANVCSSYFEPKRSQILLSALIWC